MNNDKAQKSEYESHNKKDQIVDKKRRINKLFVRYRLGVNRKLE